MNGDIIVRADERGNYIHVGGVHMDDWTEIIGTREGAKRDIYVLGDSSKSKYFGKYFDVFDGIRNFDIQK